MVALIRAGVVSLQPRILSPQPGQIISSKLTRRISWGSMTLLHLGACQFFFCRRVYNCTNVGLALMLLSFSNPFPQEFDRSPLHEETKSWLEIFERFVIPRRRRDPLVCECNPDEEQACRTARSLLTKRHPVDPPAGPSCCRLRRTSSLSMEYKTGKTRSLITPALGCGRLK